MPRRGPINIVAAVADNGAIGRNNSLLWHISADMKYFRELTTGGTVIMGRKTYESIGRPLPKRRNIVITRSTAWNGGSECSTHASGSLVTVHSLEEALDASEGPVFIIGGGEIYRQAMEVADKLYITRVQLSPEDADVFFPAISPEVWEKTNCSGLLYEDGIMFEFEIYERRKL